MTVRVYTSRGAPGGTAAAIRAIAVKHPGEHRLEIHLPPMGGRLPVLTLGDRVEVCGPLIDALEDHGRVEVHAE